MSKLSDRVRPNSEAAPWVIEEIKRLESQVDSLQHWVDHYKSAIPRGENKIVKENKELKDLIYEIKKYNGDTTKVDFLITTYKFNRQD